jgi:hypothetical protein
LIEPNKKMADAWQEIEDRAMLEAWVGDGWRPIVIEAFNKIESLLPGYEIIQIKEKFGGLRFYCENSGDEEVAAIIKEAEDRCWKTCENCGSTIGVTTWGSWIKTLCKTCHRIILRQQGTIFL